MAIGIENYPNISAPDADYPKGNIKDKTIMGAGTPVNKEVYADMHQVLSKFLSSVQLTANGLPENVTNGFQYIQAMKYALGNFNRVKSVSGVSLVFPADSEYNELVIMRPESGAANVVAIVAAPANPYIGKVFVANYSPVNVNINNVPGANMDGVAPPYVLPTLTFVEFEYDGGGPNWVIKSLFRLEL